MIVDHEIAVVLFDGETWNAICTCGWECWGQATEGDARDLFDDHVLDDVKTELCRRHVLRPAVL